MTRAEEIVLRFFPGNLHRFDEILDRLIELITVDLGALLEIFDREIPGFAMVLMRQHAPTS